LQNPSNSVDTDGRGKPTSGSSLRGRINARGLARADGIMHRIYGEKKQSLFQNLPDEIVEIGPGAGANFRYYRKGQRVIAIEPNEAYHARLKERALECQLELTIKSLHAERIDLESNSARAVIGTLVLCSVENPALALAEVLRILKPGHPFHFVEHVVAPRPGLIRLFQRLLHRPWHWLFDGCNLDRNTGDQLRRAGFTEVDLRPFSMYSPLFPVTPHIYGTAIK
jgi:SAM-dependent methyltransferase